ncbi:hypothetical protein SMJ63A_80041 [Stenotrophomonas geniculata]
MRWSPMRWVMRASACCTWARSSAEISLYSPSSRAFSTRRTCSATGACPSICMAVFSGLAETAPDSPSNNAIIVMRYIASLRIHPGTMGATLRPSRCLHKGPAAGIKKTQAVPRLGLKSYPDTDPAERQSCGSLKATPAPIKGMLKPASFAHENFK